MRRAWLVAICGLVVVGVLAGIGLQLNPAEAQVKDLPGAATPSAGAAARPAGITPGVMKPFDILVRETPRSEASRIVATLEATPGVGGAAAPPRWTPASAYLVEAFPSVDGDSSAVNRRSST